MTSTRVTVVGSINADQAISLSRLPGPGETVSARTLSVALGGKGANQAVAAARAGAIVSFVGAVGAADGADLREALVNDGIDIGALDAIDGAPTGLAVVLVDDEGENSIVVVPGANGAISEATVTRAMSSMSPGDVLLLQNEVPTAVSRTAARIAHQHGAVVVWNAAPAPSTAPQLVTDVDVLIVNEHELALVASLLDLRDADQSAGFDALVAAVAEHLDCDVVCTRGGEGASFRLDGVSGHMPAARVTVVDTTAAGDTFVGYFAAHTALAPAARIQRSLTAGSLTVTRRGAAASIPTSSEVDSFDATIEHPERT